MKKGLWLLLLPTLSWATGEGVPKVLPSTGTITVNGAIQFTSTMSVTWSLAAGSYGTISSTGLYHATTGYFQAQNLSAAGTQLGPNDAIWNTDISGAPLDANSAAKIDFLRVEASSPHVTVDPTIPRNQYSTGVSSQSMVFRSSPQWNDTFFFMPSSFTRVQQASVMSNRPSELAQFGQDHHILGVSTDTLQAYEIFNFYPAGTDTAAPNSNCESGCIYDPNGYALPDTTGGHGTCTNAAGLLFQPYLLRNSELESGKINHTMFCTIDNGNNFNGFQWPATNSTNQCNDATRCIKYGAILRLKSSYSCAGFTPKAQAICNALKTHGCINGDGGPALAIVADYDLTQSTSDWAAVFTEFSTGASSVTWSDMEVIDVSGLMKSSFTANVDPANGFVTPSPFVQVLAKNTVDGQVSSTTIALQPVVVGWQNPAHQGADAGVNVMAGTPQFLISSWVTGSTDSVLSCSMTPTVGSIATSAAGCLYTAPTSQYNQVLITTVTIKSRIDPNHNSASFYLTVFSSDAIRVREGPAISGADTKPPFDNNGNYTDSTTGNIYFETPTNMLSNWSVRTTQGSASWPNQMFNQVDYGAGDKLFTAMVPPGNYTLTSAHGRSDNSSGDITASSNCIESQNILIVSTISLAPAALTPKIVTSTITVGSDFKFHWRIVGNSGSQLSVDNSHNFMSYWILESTTTPSAPSITSSLSASGTVGQAFSYQITATNSPTSYDADVLPGGLSVTFLTGVISGTPTTAGVSTTTISATNAGGTGTALLTITISAAPPPPPPPPPPPATGGSDALFQGRIEFRGKVTVP